jgi:hypothetical protein
MPRKPKGQGIKLAPEVQAEIFAALLTGQFGTDAELAHSKGVSKQTVSRLKRLIPAEYLRQAQAMKDDKIGRLVFEYLEESLQSSMRIDGITHDKEWLRSQDAASLATLYGVKADKVFRILEAIERANERPEGDE